MPVLLVLVSALLSQPRFTRITKLESGPYEPFGNVLCCDSDHDGAQEIIFCTGTIYPSDPLRWEVWEHRPMNRYELVFADTGAYPSPPGITTGNFIPFDVGDIDQDGLTDLVGVNWECVPDSSLYYNLVVVMESPDSFSYPDSMVWWFRWGRCMAGTNPPYFTSDLDRDGRREILMATTSDWFGNCIWENVGNNRNELVWNSLRLGAPAMAIGDFDLDGLGEFAGGFSATLVCENAVAGQDTYALVFTDTTGWANGYDVFAGRDLDQDGKPEFFIRFHEVRQDRFLLYMWETTGNNTYQRTLIDEKVMFTKGGSRSVCGDLDGDGVEELVWALPLGLFVYKAVGNNQFREVWSWWDDHGSHETILTNIHDMNGNGYNELVVGGSGKTSVFEVEAIKVRYPDVARSLVAGDTCLVRWRIFTPPRCDSVSLFLKTDTTIHPGEMFWRLDTIATGLSPADSVYPWVVSDTTLRAAWIVAIAYGPGWQYDESDSCFAILPTGVARGETPLLLPVRPPTVVRGVLFMPAPPFTIHHSLFDMTGRAVMELHPGANDVRGLPAGVYFVRQAVSDERSAVSVRKVVIQR